MSFNATHIMGPAELSACQNILFFDKCLSKKNDDVSYLINSNFETLNSASMDQNILVFRNHSFEFIAKLITKLSSIFGLKLNFEYSEYSNVFSVDAFDYDSYELIIFWIDFNLIGQDARLHYIEYLFQLIEKIQTTYKKRIIISAPHLPHDLTISQQFMETFSSTECETLQIQNIIEMKEKDCEFDVISFLGTYLTLDDQFKISKYLTLELSKRMQALVKLIIVDLDNTLYNGILGEDGPNGISISTNNKKCIKKLRELYELGIIISFVSKNIEGDFHNLLNKNRELKGILELGIHNKINWHPKYENILEICELLNILPQNVLFIDDNPGELAEIFYQLPEVRCILASERNGSANTADILLNYPFNSTETNETDKLRIKDLKANQQRKYLQSVNQFSGSYIESSNVCITFHVNDVK